MKSAKVIFAILAICVSVPAVSLVSVVSAASGGQYILDWNSIDGGGRTSSGGQYTLTGTIGQPDAGYLYGGQFDLEGGFQTGGALCFVNLEDFAKFAEYWLVSGSGLPADLYPDGIIDSDDLAELAYLWLRTCPYGWPLK